MRKNLFKRQGQATPCKAVLQEVERLERLFSLYRGQCH